MYFYYACSVENTHTHTLTQLTAQWIKIHFALCVTLPRSVINFVNCVVCNKNRLNYTHDARTIERVPISRDGKPAQLKTVGKTSAQFKNQNSIVCARVRAQLFAHTHVFIMKSATKVLCLFMKNVRINWKMFVHYSSICGACMCKHVRFIGPNEYVLASIQTHAHTSYLVVILEKSL